MQERLLINADAAAEGQTETCADAQCAYRCAHMQSIINRVEHNAK